MASLEENKLTIKFKKLYEGVKAPIKANDTDAGWDLFSRERVYLYTNKVAKIATGIAVNIPPGYVGVIRDRSSMASKGIAVGGGIIDSGYTGEIIVMLNHFETNIHKNEDYIIEKGDKIAQMLILPVPDVEFQHVSELEQTARAEKGFGSSGK